MSNVNEPIDGKAGEKEGGTLGICHLVLPSGFVARAVTRPVIALSGGIGGSGDGMGQLHDIGKGELY